MKFATINALYLIWIVPVLLLFVVYGAGKRKKILNRYAGSNDLKIITPGYSVKKRRITSVLFLLSILFMTISMAGPRYGFKWEKIERKGIDIFVAIDCSRSMMAEDISPSRLTRAKHEVFDLLSMLEGDRAGLVAFAGTAFIQCPLTLDYEAFNIFMNTLSPDYMPVGGTDIAGAINAAISGFDTQNNSEKAVIIITDGDNTGEDLDDAVDNAIKNNVRLFCVGVGRDEGIPVPDGQGGFKKDRNNKIILTKIDSATLQKIAEKTGGTYVKSVAGDMDLDKIYRQEIRKEMDKTTLSSTRKKVWEDRYQWFLGIAVILLSAGMLVPSGENTRKGLVCLFLSICIFGFTPGARAADFYKNNKQGVEAFNNEDYSKATDFFTAAQLEDPDDPIVFYNLAASQYKSEEYESALNNYQKVLATKDDALKQKALYNMGNTYFRLGKYEEAISSYEKALKVKPDDTKTSENIDFVKKVMEEQKKQEQEEKDKQDKKDEQEKNKNQNDQKQQQGQDEQKDQNPDNNQNKKDEQQNPEKQKQEQQNQNQDKQEKEAQQGSKGNKEEKAPEDSKENQGTSQAEKMLNRLQDVPGKAMIPAYDKRSIEKDW